MTPLALNWPRSGHVIQVIPIRPSYLEICTLRGVTQPYNVGVDPSYRPRSEKKSATSLHTSIHNACSLRGSVFILIQELLPQSPIDSPLFLPPFPFQLAIVHLWCLQPPNNPSRFCSNGNSFMKPHLKHIIAVTCIHFYFPSR